MAHNLNSEIVRGASIDNLALEIQNQADELFPHRIDDQMWLKLWTEMGEFAKDRTQDEMADVLIMILDYASRKMWNIEASIRHKMHVNQFRTWKLTNGVWQHE
jgi:predicted house-cleaning noncanonical NTP pyrophosphatase (MazG superfamily)